MTIDLTGVAVAITGGIFSILGIVITVWLQKHVNDKAAAATLANAITNSLGAVQQAATSEIQQLHPQIAGVPAILAPGVQYVLDHASDEATRFGVTPVAIAQKIEAQIGLANIATNLAVSSNATPAVARPLGTVPPAPAAAL